MEYCAPNGWLLTAMLYLVLILGALCGWLGITLADIYRQRKLSMNSSGGKE